MTDAPDVEGLVAELTRRGLTLSVAESLTGGLLVAEFVRVPGASAVIRGAVIAYATDVKHSVLGVDAQLLAAEGPVHADVARQMASGARTLLGRDSVPTDLALATTGVAGPGPQDGHPAGEAFVAIADAEGSRAVRLQLGGGREHIRRGVVSESLRTLQEWLDSH